MAYERSTRKDPGRGSAKPYHCSLCGQWHLGRGKERPPTVRRPTATGIVTVTHYKLGDHPIMVCVAEDAGTYGIGVGIITARRDRADAEDLSERNARRNLASHLVTMTAL